jgi:tripartite-type tricarboxylate transporter receptor subunit TctC
MALLLGAVTAGAASVAARAQGADAYPSRPARIMVGFAAGGLTDLSARLYAEELQKRFGQSFIVENRAGAAGLLALQAVARAQPDGYTLLLGSGVGVNPIFLKDGVDILKELAPVSNMQAGGLVLYITSRYPVTSFDELLAYEKAHPGTKLNLGSSNNTLALFMEMVKLRKGVDFVNVPYKGQAPVAQALAAGEVDLSVDSLTAFKPLLDAGKIRPLFITKKTSMLPGVPTPAELGMPGFDVGFNLGFWVPLDTPPAVIARLHDGLAVIANLPAVQDKVRSVMGNESVGSTPEDLAKATRQDAAFWAEAARIGHYVPQ